MISLSLIGPGRHGTAIAQLFAAHGVDVTLFHYRPEKAAAAARAVTAAAVGANVKVAASPGSRGRCRRVVALTTLWDAPQREVISRIGDRLVGKVLLDVSNPLDVTPTGIHFRTPVEGSAGQFVATLLPAGVGHVKAFSNLATAALRTAADQTPAAVLPYLADSVATAHRVRPLLARTGWPPRYVGGHQPLGGDRDRRPLQQGHRPPGPHRARRARVHPAVRSRAASGGLNDAPRPRVPAPMRRRLRSDTTGSRSGATWCVPTTRLMKQFQAELKCEFDLSVPQYDALLRLSLAPGKRLAMGEVAEALLYSSGAATKLFDRARRKGTRRTLRRSQRPSHRARQPDRRGHGADRPGEARPRRQHHRQTRPVRLGRGAPPRRGVPEAARSTEARHREPDRALAPRFRAPTLPKAFPERPDLNGPAPTPTPQLHEGTPP